MPRLRLRHPDLPPALTGWVAANSHLQPRFWATVWADVLKAKLDEGTRGRHLASVERLYESAARQLGDDRLDAVLARADFETLEAVLGGFLTTLRNESAVQATDREGTWNSALLFVGDVIEHLGRTPGERFVQVSAGLLRLSRLYAQVAPTAPRPPAPVRALPAVVVEDLYRLFRPDSPDNPFRTPALRWRNFLVFLLLLHLGLRRGEALILRADAIKDDYDPASGEVRYWLNVDETPYEDEDPRYDAPGLKTQHSRRQLPVSREIVTVVDVVVTSYRGRPGHGYLLVSQKGGPLAARSLHEIFERVTEHLSGRARRALADRGTAGVSAHDLRHTCAVHRLRRYLDRGDDMDKAIEKLRVFFGWSEASEMPRHYARAYFETGLAEIWNEHYDAYVETLRSIEGRPA